MSICKCVYNVYTELDKAQSSKKLLIINFKKQSEKIIYIEWSVTR